MTFNYQAKKESSLNHSQSQKDMCLISFKCISALGLSKELIIQISYKKLNSRKLFYKEG